MISYDRFALDVPVFVRDALRPGNGDYGSLDLKNNEFKVGTQPSLRSEKRYELHIFEEQNGAGELSGFVILDHPVLTLCPRLVLLLGTPIGFNEFVWRGYCPKTQQVSTALFFDPSTSLLVSYKALDLPLPFASGRLRQNFAMIDAIEKGWNPAHFSWDLDLEALPQIAQPDMLPASRIKALKDDFLFAWNGLPKAVWHDDGALDIFSMIGPNKVRRYPLKRVLKGMRAALPLK